MKKLTKSQKNNLIIQKLQEMYPSAGPELVFHNPFETLVATILSAQCTDVQVNKVTPEVFRRYPDAFAMAECPEEDLYALVRSCGFASKAKNIINASKILVEKYNGKVPNDMDSLQELPGVGRKTANVVMANAFHVPSIAVDTHVFRVSNRIGLAKAKNVEETEKQLMKNIPQEKWIDAHHWLIFHGRRVCKARNPLCKDCDLQELCDYYKKIKKEI